jgi:type 1 glutamine amidotransferase
VLFAQDPAAPGLIDPNYLFNIPGLEALDDADLMIIFTRFRELPKDQMQHIDDYLKKGKPVLGIRTATHAFNVKDSTSHWQHYSNGYAGDMNEWTDGFGRLVLGERWFSHHGHHKHQSTRGLIADGASDHPIVQGINNGDIWGSTDVYGVRLPLPGDSQPIILGQVVDRAGDFDENDLFYGLRETDNQIASTNPGSKKDYNPNNPMMPIAWTKSYQLPGGQTGKSFTSTIGSSSDLLNEGVRRLLVNATYWLVGVEVPTRANVSLVGEYNPSAYGFKTEEGFWENRNLQVADFK